MEYSNAEVLCLLEYTSWWMSFYDDNCRAPTIGEMRTKLATDKLKRQHDVEMNKLRDELKCAKQEIELLKNKK